ncbi:MAG: radical SAM protein [Candidatus Thiodiazotropha endolucinida]|uniref:Antilisterial bacteriocin subtilosin biosynthesis protein AlbA n=1 Tax=Candidatus Thiodiazotropha endolucinida TaxID=1655433 RepID=A0A7Z0VQU1_9GAMM|nr:radical SAM protein [Candidatus Thiodiazotropha endolucinida]ODJ89661.1 antilisterial bacteriocin subtilosin biosynthesis protein AlbA [Candidatus Thiodiazotropha endolucinida]
MNNSDLFLLAVNLTRRCNLACAHCYMDADTRMGGGSDELSTVEITQLLDEIASRTTETMVVLTGGEPLLRRDLELLVAHGSGLGLSMVVGTNGVLLNEDRVKALKQAGVLGMGISLDSLDAQSHDNFRGCPGSWERTLAGMDLCRQHDLPFQVHFSVTEQNAHEVDSMIDFAKAVGAYVLNVFFLICTGRGESMSDITPARYEQVLLQLVQAQEKTEDLIVRARCAPHFKRVAYQSNPESSMTLAQGYEGGGCLAGIHCCRITPEGGVTACPYIPDEEGSIRIGSFWEIWDQTPTFGLLRHPKLEGKCGKCEYQKLCGGCRARPLAMGGTLMDADPWCGHYPSGEPVIEPLRESQDSSVIWSSEAEQRLSHVPGFLRKMVRKRAESYVSELGEKIVTTEHMAVLAAKRFGDKFPAKRPPHASSDHAETFAEFSTSGFAWTQEARAYLDALPGFLREGVFAVAEDVAREEGRLEVNIKLLQRLEEEDTPGRKLPWEVAAETLLSRNLADRPPQVKMFVQPSVEAAAEREAKRRHAIVVSADDVARIIETGLAGVEWEQEALERVESAPEFVRGGIKKAAEFGARREGLSVITSEDLTRFRNRAMMKAVRRMKGFGMQELNFDAFTIAKQRVPRLKENLQAEKRFAEIKRYVESKQAPDGSGLGLLDRDLLEKMKAELRRK